MAVIWLLACLVLPEWWQAPPETATEPDEQTLQEETDWLVAHPVNLNTAGIDELLAIPWLNPVLAYRILALRDSLGRFEEVTQLRLAPGMTEELFRTLVPVLTAAQPDLPWRAAVTIRSQVDPLKALPTDASWFGRAHVERGPWQAVAVVDKDRGEPGPADWLGLALAWRHHGFGVLAGDFSFGSGLGLVFSGPHRRAGSWRGGVKGPGNLRSIRSAQEHRALHGAGFEYRTTTWSTALFGSWAGRDAVLNDDGTVSRLVLSGLHDDSASIARKHAVDEIAAGLRTGFATSHVEAGLNGALVGYSRNFAPQDTAASLVGGMVESGGIDVAFRAGNYRLAAEGALSGGGGAAWALELDGNWQGLSTAAGVSSYDTRFFAPLGRSRRVTDREPRVYARGRLGYRAGGLSVGVRGNTWRDYDIDSLPATVEARVGYTLGPVSATVTLGRSYRLDAQHSRTSKLEVRVRHGAVEANMHAADRYRADGTGRGRMAGIRGRVDFGPAWVAVGTAGFGVEGSGVTMYFREPTEMRTTRSFSRSADGWRVTVAAGTELGLGFEVGGRLGLTMAGVWETDFGVQVEWSVD